MKYNCIRVRKGINGDLRLEVTEDHEDREDTQTAPNGLFYYYPHTMSHRVAIHEFVDHNVNELETAIDAYKAAKDAALRDLGPAK